MSLFTTRPPATKPAKVPEETFLATIWAGVAVSFIFLCIRLYARIKSFKRLFWDDALVIFSWILALLTAVDWQIVSKGMYQFIAITSGKLWPPPETFVDDTQRYYKGSMIVLAFFYTSLWSIKFAFLIFFRVLGSNIRSQKIHWWVVFSFTLISYLVCFGDTQYWCLVSPLQEIFAKCSSDANIRAPSFLYEAILMILVMTIPSHLLWRVRISTKKKLALFGIFSLVIITMIFAIVRTVVISSLTRQPDTSWSYMWSSIEQNVAIIVGCLASFRALFTNSSGKAEQTYTPPSPGRRTAPSKSIPLSPYGGLDSQVSYDRSGLQIDPEDIESGIVIVKELSQSSDAPIIRLTH